MGKASQRKKLKSYYGQGKSAKNRKNNTNLESTRTAAIGNLDLESYIEYLDNKFKKPPFPKREINLLPKKAIPLAKELWDMSEFCPEPISSSERCVYLGEHQEKTREIGAKLFSIGGGDLMFTVADLMPKYDQRELDLAWDGIGDWRA